MFVQVYLLGIFPIPHSPSSFSIFFIELSFCQEFTWFGWIKFFQASVSKEYLISFKRGQGWGREDKRSLCSRELKNAEVSTRSPVCGLQVFLGKTSCISKWLALPDRGENVGTGRSGVFIRFHCTRTVSQILSLVHTLFCPQNCNHGRFFFFWPKLKSILVGDMDRNTDFEKQS